jgi:hypothetical protein
MVGRYLDTKKYKWELIQILYDFNLILVIV